MEQGEVKRRVDLWTTRLLSKMADLKGGLFKIALQGTGGRAGITAGEGHLGHIQEEDGTLSNDVYLRRAPVWPPKHRGNFSVKKYMEHSLTSQLLY